MIAKLLRQFGKPTNLYFPSGKVIKEGDIIALEDDFNSIDFTGIVIKQLDGSYWLNAGHKKYPMPDNDTLANMERCWLLGICIKL
mgnify:CR=1 FL=1